QAIEDFVVHALQEITADAPAIKRAVAEASAGNSTALAGLKEQLSEIDKALIKAKQEAEEATDDFIELRTATVRKRAEAAEDRISRLKAERLSVQGEIMGLEQEAINATILAEVYEDVGSRLGHALEAGSREEARSLIRALVKSIDWKPTSPSAKTGNAK